jgi:hypothetical protein
MLQAEIASNSTSVANVFTVSATATAALIGYGLQSENWLVFLSPFALLLPSPWFVSSQLESTTRIATYIRTFIEPEVEGLAWENRLATLRCRQLHPESRYTVSITGIYGASGLVSLILAWSFAPSDMTTRIVLAAVSTSLLVLTFVLSMKCRACLLPETMTGYLKSWERLRELEREPQEN